MTKETELENVQVMAVGSDGAAALERASIDVQISTAHQYPRSMQSFKDRATGMATIDEDTAASCIYKRPVGKEGKQMKYAEGLSVRMAEIVGACYGNLRVGSTLIEQTDRVVKARGIAHDLESNFASAVEVVESTVDKHGNPYSERMRIVVAKAALAKARRDATFQVVPKALCKPIENAAREVAIGDQQTLEKRRARVVQWVNSLKIDNKQVWNSLGIKGPSDIDLHILETLTGIRTAIKDGDTTVAEAFPAPEIKEPKAKDDENTDAEPEIVFGE
jgi:hypothetical protein